MPEAAARVGACVTPVILTFNEGPNIDATLRALTWADQVVIVDSGSTDDTEQLARAFPNVRWLVHPFESHGRQWDFAVRSADVRTPYVLALDADYLVTDAFVQELSRDFAGHDYNGGIAGFEYRIHGRALLGSVYPAKLVVFRRDRVQVSQPGHTQVFAVDQPIYRFRSRIVHDDRKPLDRFVRSQLEYARLESVRLGTDGAGRWQDRLRRAGVMPLVAGLGAYVRSGGPLRGTASLRYAYERTLFECLLALRLFDRDQGAPRGDAALHAGRRTAENIRDK